MTREQIIEKLERLLRYYWIKWFEAQDLNEMGKIEEKIDYLINIITHHKNQLKREK